MKKLSSQPVIKELVERFQNKFVIKTESENKFCFDEAYYQPDLVLWDKDEKTIKAIIEVEQGTRKHVVGGAITADYCMMRLKQSPIMIILALTEQDKKDYHKRENLLKEYMKHIKKIFVGDIDQVIKIIGNI